MGVRPPSGGEGRGRQEPAGEGATQTGQSQEPGYTQVEWGGDAEQRAHVWRLLGPGFSLVEGRGQCKGGGLGELWVRTWEENATDTGTY